MSQQETDINRTTTENTNRFNTFLLLCFGRTLSFWGTQLSGFGLGFAVFEETKSSFLFSLVIFATSAPQILFALLAGVIADTTNRKKLLLAEQIGAGTCAFLLAILAVSGITALSVLLPLIAIQSCFVATQFQSFSIVTTSLVHKDQLGRANGLIQLGMAIAQIAGPGAAGLLLPAMGLSGILIVDAATFFISAALVVFAEIPKRVVSYTPGELKPKLSFRDQVADGWSFLSEKSGLIWLMGYAGVMNFVGSVVRTLIPPMVISIANTQTAGFASSLYGFAIFLGGVAMSVWGGPKIKINGVFLFTLIQGLTVVFIIFPSIYFIYIAGFIYSFVFPMQVSCNQTIWQKKTPIELQGRIFAIRVIFSQTPTLIAFVAAGYLSQHVFEPLMQPGAWGAVSFGWLFGVGTGRGFAVMLFLSGILLIISTLLSFLNPRVRNLEEEISNV